MEHNLYLIALLCLLAAAFWDTRPQLQVLLGDLTNRAPWRAPTEQGLFLFSRRKAGGGSRRNGTKRRVGPNEWELRAELPRALDGSRRRTYEKFVGTSREADRRLVEILDEVESLEVVERPDTINDLLDRWLESEVKPTVREVTYLDYKRRADTYLRPLIGKLKLRNFTLAKAEDLRNALSSQKVKVRSKKRARRTEAPRTISPTTVKNVLKTMSMALNYARRHGFVVTNVMHDLKRRQWDDVEEKERALTGEELSRFLEAARGNYWYALFVLIASTGMRPSEALALSWSHVKDKEGWIQIERKLSLLPGGQFRFDPPKTKGSKRPVPLSPRVRTALLNHMKRQTELRAYDEDLDLVFGDLEGRPADSRNILRRHVKPIAKKAGIQRSVTLYGLRHTFMTIATNDTGSAKLTSEVLGHKDVAFSQNTYQDPQQEDLRRTAVAMDAYVPDEEVPEGDAPDADGAHAAD